jgi:FixJ family two-component response regulator
LSTNQGSLVYVIDDESEVRRSLHFLLSTIGLVSWPFASAQDFLDNFDTLEAAPILLDIRMPAIDGLQLMSIMHQRGVNWPIIAISAHGDIQVAVKAIKLGAAEFLEKPFKLDELDRCLRSAFAQLAGLKGSHTSRNTARAATTYWAQTASVWFWRAFRRYVSAFLPILSSIGTWSRTLACDDRLTTPILPYELVK